MLFLYASCTCRVSKSCPALCLEGLLFQGRVSVPARNSDIVVISFPWNWQAEQNVTQDAETGQEQHET